MSCSSSCQRCAAHVRLQWQISQMRQPCRWYNRVTEPTVRATLSSGSTRVRHVKHTGVVAGGVDAVAAEGDTSGRSSDVCGSGAAADCCGPESEAAAEGDHCADVALWW